MKTSLKGLVELAGHEGICLSKYKDSVGVWTIGVGATRSEIKDIAKWPLNKKITIEYAFELLQKSIVKYERAINKALKVDVEQHVFDALVSWCYNVGVGWVNRSTILRLINRGEKSQTRLYNALMKYKKPKEIVGRRRKEAKLLTTGIYSNNGKALVFPVNGSGRPIYSRGKTIDVSDYLRDYEEKKAPETATKAVEAPSTFEREMKDEAFKKAFEAEEPIEAPQKTKGIIAWALGRLGLK